MKILIAYDGSACADAALADLRYAGLPPVVDALVLSVADVWLPAEATTEGAPAQPLPAAREAGERARKALEEARAMAAGAAERLRADFPGWTTRAAARTDSPAWAIIKESEERPVDLIVVGSQGRSVWGRLVLGSVSQQVLTEARCSVRVARGRARADEAPIRLIVGVDGSSDARRTARTVAARNWPSGGTARVVVVIDSALWAAVPPLLRSQPNPAQVFAEQLAQEAVQMLQAAGLQTVAVVQEGDPKRILPAEVERENADCVFLGARGLGRVERFLLGSVSTAVAMRARCSVEVVREPAKQG